MIYLDDDARFKQAAECLCPQLFKKISILAPKLSSNAQEIRLRVNRPLTVVCPNITYYVTLSGGLSSAPISDSMLFVTRNDIADTFHNICNYSVYAKQNEIVNGFVTMTGGHRAGICGTAINDSGQITNVRDISSINIRIAREHKGCAEELIKKVGDVNGGLLICGAPCSGKTTVLRDLARILSTDNKNVSLIDERGELAGTCSGVFQNDIGMCDVFDCYRKSTGIMQAIRSMAPDVVVCDEIGSQDDINAITHSVNCGVTMVATVHAAGKSELRQREIIKKIVQTGAFKRIVFLSNRSSPGEIKEILQVGDVFDF